MAVIGDSLLLMLGSTKLTAVASNRGLIRWSLSARQEWTSSRPIEAFLLQAGFVESRRWVEELVHRIDAEHLLRLRTSLGSMKPRFDSLSPHARASCLAEARGRMEAMPSEAFVARADLVYSAARA